MDKAILNSYKLIIRYASFWVAVVIYAGIWALVLTYYESGTFKRKGLFMKAFSSLWIGTHVIAVIGLSIFGLFWAWS